MRNPLRRRPKYAHGWKKDKFRPCAYHTIVAAVPDITILDQYLPDVQHQGNESSCVGQGEDELLVACAKMQGVYTGKFSARWIYNGARFIEGTLALDNGCYPSDGWNWLLSKGGLLDIIWPYIPQSDINTPPPSKYDPEAAKYPLLSAVRVVGGVDGICSAISLGHYVGVGTPWFAKWDNSPSNGKLAEVTVSDIVEGGHFTILYGYDKLQKIFYGQNSWGTNWGNGGRFTMPFSAFDVFPQFGGWDGWYVTVDWGTQPTPPPPTPPEPPAPPTPPIPPTPPTPPTPTPQLRARLQGSIDGGISWRTLFDIGFNLLSRMVRKKKVKS